MTKKQFAGKEIRREEHIEVFFLPFRLPGKQIQSYLNFASNFRSMKKWGLLLMVFLILFLFISPDAEAQCSICSKTASQLGEKPAKALNSAIIYLMASPLLIIGFIGWRWWKTQGKYEE